MQFGRACVLVAFCAPAAAETVATPATLQSVLAAARPGATVVLAPGSYDIVSLRDRHWSPPITVDARQAELRGVQLLKVSGVTWRGGAFDGGDVERGGFNAHEGDHIVIDGATFRHFTRAGIGFGTISDARIVNNTITDSGSDGIDIALSRRIVVDHNRCVDFHPTPGAHPDCIQLWSRPTVPPTADITITNNEADGDMQGFTLFNHIRDGVDDGGFDRITIENNHARVKAYWGIGAYDCRNCVVRHNRVETISDPDKPRLHAWVKLIRGDAVNCDNRARSLPDDVGHERCRDGRDLD